MIVVGGFAAGLHDVELGSSARDGRGGCPFGLLRLAFPFEGDRAISVFKAVYIDRRELPVDIQGSARQWSFLTIPAL